MGISVRNIVAFIWLVFSGIITLRVLNPIYNLIFGLTWENLLLKYSLQFIFGIFIFAVCFFIPFRAFTDVSDRMGWDID